MSVSETTIIIIMRRSGKVGVIRSVTVNALRKFEIDGVIESRSLGMKSILIKILNNKLIDELIKIKL